MPVRGQTRRLPICWKELSHVPTQETVLHCLALPPAPVLQLHFDIAIFWIER